MPLTDIYLFLSTRNTTIWINLQTVAARKRVSRRLTFDEDKTSPVSGTLIRELADGEEIPMYQTGKFSICQLLQNHLMQKFFILYYFFSQ